LIVGFLSLASNHCPFYLPTDQSWAFSPLWQTIVHCFSLACFSFYFLLVSQPTNCWLLEMNNSLPLLLCMFVLFSLPANQAINFWPSLLPWAVCNKGLSATSPWLLCILSWFADRPINIFDLLTDQTIISRIYPPKLLSCLLPTNQTSIATFSSTICFFFGWPTNQTNCCLSNWPNKPSLPPSYTASFGNFDGVRNFLSKITDEISHSVHPFIVFTVNRCTHGLLLEILLQALCIHKSYSRISSMKMPLSDLLWWNPFLPVLGPDQGWHCKMIPG